GTNTQIRGRYAFAGEGLLQVLLQQLRGCEHQPAVGVRNALEAANQALLALFKKGGVELLPQATDQRGGLARTRWPKDQQSLVERQAKDFILVLIEHGLIPEP